MGRILAIDYGGKRTGIAVTDPLQLIATSLEMVRSHELIAFLKQYLQKETVDAFVVGMPKKLDNTDTNGTLLVNRFLVQLKKEFAEMPVHLIDERFTSKMAMDTMIAGGMKKKDRRIKGNVDKISAVIILQSYMESNRL
ncbi:MULTISPECIES: Holliday junction resolvase RuvX [unclassified Imperialibacter]|uniref:Holliday junction resolvase RuvX n=1 Tax=unclassified Imperialibacter TaxID=2629706 RepID=UPI0012584BBB|nr:MULTISPECIES: Holliday junction resolvase RuvX [unclassified Imperialibacter]CAD5248035.1 putative pre-16S rRNA nuclease [Imperialibacter sp. 75]CAD5248151.1 putative pre-16S rRNA nuclease [Imperialibacter sp. 89]VVS97404.1 putative pre-16S rRNA nuclease [Imperialibacter sp. EC-SDR9]